MRRGGYPMDLTRQVKVRIDEDTFEKLSQLSEENQRPKSWILRDIIVRSLFKIASLEI